MNDRLRVMKAVSDGQYTVARIAKATGLDPNAVNSYLTRLIENGTVARTVDECGECGRRHKRYFATSNCALQRAWGGPKSENRDTA